MSDTSSPQRLGSEPERAGATINPRSADSLHDVQPRPLLRFDQDDVAVAPATSHRVTLQIKNVGTIVENYSVAVVGEAATWVSTTPTDVALFPGESADVSVIIRPPRSSSVLAGYNIVAVQVYSNVDYSISAVEEIGINVLPFHAFESVFSLSSVRLIRKSRLHLRCTNTGNSPISLHPRRTNPDDTIRTEFGEHYIDIDPGAIHDVEVIVRHKLRFFGSPVTHPLQVTTAPINTSGDPAFDQEVKPRLNRAVVIQRPLLRVRLGFLARVLALIAILAMIALFVISRLPKPAPPEVGAPNTPANLRLAHAGPDALTLTWTAAAGATGYKVFSEAVAAPSTSAAPSGAGASSGVASSAGGSSEAPLPDARHHDPSPFCAGCSSIAQLPVGNTLYTVTSVPTGKPVCYRVLATDGDRTSLFTPPVCTTIPAPTAAQSAAAAGAAAAASQSAAAAAAAAAAAVEVPACHPKLLPLKKSAPGALAIVWQPATKPPAGFTAKTCNAKATLTGFEIQQQISKGWADISPQPTANDTATQTTGLLPATKYCYRIRALAQTGNSAYTEPRCGKTSKTPPAPTATPTPTPTQSTSSAPRR